MVRTNSPSAHLQVEALADVLRALVDVAAQHTEPAVLESTTGLARALCAAPYGVALLTGPDGLPSALAHQGMTSAMVAALPRLPGPVGLLGVVLGGETLRLDRLQDHPAAAGLPDGHAPMVALLGVPIALEGRVLGGLYLTRTDAEPPFTAYEEALAGAVAHQAARAVDGLRRRAAADSVVAALGGPAVRAGEQTGALDDGTASPVVQRLLSAARRTLGTELVLLSRLEDDRQTFTHVDSAGPGIALEAGTSAAASQGYCRLMLDGTIPSSVPDVPAHPLLADLPVTAALGVGSYAGVPVRLPDGRLHGTLCAMDSTPGSGPTASQLESMGIIAGLLGDALSSQEHAERAHRDRVSAFRSLFDGTRRCGVLQPIVDLQRSVPVGFEALSRFTDPHGAPRRPDDVFEEGRALGLAVRLEQAAVRDALTLLPVLPAGTYLSVNLSPAGLLDPATHELLTSVPLHHLVLELTEHEQIEDYAPLLQVLAGLRERGLRLAVDDAGSGFASLQHVTRLEPDIIKLDIAFVRDVDTDPSRRAVARAMVSFAAELSATLVAEGIETAGELRQLRALGARVGQGYHLGRPAAPGQVLAHATQRAPSSPAPA